MLAVLSCSFLYGGGPKMDGQDQSGLKHQASLQLNFSLFSRTQMGYGQTLTHASARGLRLTWWPRQFRMCTSPITRCAIELCGRPHCRAPTVTSAEFREMGSSVVCLFLLFCIGSE